MPVYEFKCEEHGVFERVLTFEEFDLLDKDEDTGSTVATCDCGATALKVFSRWAFNSSSDDPSFSCTPGVSDFQRNGANREAWSFGDMDHDGWVERDVGNKGQWEYAD